MSFELYSYLIWPAIFLIFVIAALAGAGVCWRKKRFKAVIGLEIVAIVILTFAMIIFLAGVPWCI